MMRRLQHAEFFIFKEPADRQLQERTGRHVVAVKNRHKLAFRLFQCVIDVARFGIFTRFTGDVFHTNFMGKIGEFLPVAVIKQINGQFVPGPVETQRGVQRRFHDAEIFVIRRDQ
ncbi:hypothetical protein SRABI106_02952 [Rahnella aquatilis]|nr:hypothetical protein SRABI106_02952 [Rahnella aquatilis]